MGRGKEEPTKTTIDLNPKNIARIQARAVRSHLHPTWARETSAAVAERVLALPEIVEARTVGCYLARPLEVQTSALIERLQALGKRVCVPAHRVNRGEYALCELRPGEPLHEGPHGIPEPAWPRWVDMAEVDAMLVPCLAFDPHLRRLGHGGGNMDRLLAGHRCRRIALAFEAQKLTAVPTEPHDVPMHRVVTERAVYDGQCGPTPPPVRQRGD